MPVIKNKRSILVEVNMSDRGLRVNIALAVEALLGIKGK